MLLLLFAGCAAGAHPASGPVAPPPDKPVDATTTSTRDKLFEAMKPYVAQARATYPAAKQRFVSGLPNGSAFFLTVRLTDPQERIEQVFVKVDKIENDRVTGKIWSDIQRVSGYSLGQTYEFPEQDLLDWLISNADGTEEGNFVGKFLDTWQND